MTDEFRDLTSLTPQRQEPASPPPTETHGDEIGGWAIIGFALLVVGTLILGFSVGQDDSAGAAFGAIIGSLVSMVGFFATLVAAVAKGVQIGNRS
jgi:hypothetical protein